MKFLSEHQIFWLITFYPQLMNHLIMIRRNRTGVWFPISVMFGKFRVDGKTRISQQVEVKKALEISREEFKSIYDANVYSPLMPSLGVVNVPMLLIRQSKAIFAE